MDSDPISTILNQNNKQQQTQKMPVKLLVALIFLGFIGFWSSTYFFPQEPPSMLCQISWPQKNQKMFFEFPLDQTQKLPLSFTAITSDLQNINILLTIKSDGNKLQFEGKASQPLKIIYKDLKILVYIDAAKNRFSQKKLHSNYKQAEQEMYRLASQLTSAQKKDFATQNTFISLYENIYLAKPNAVEITYYQFIPNTPLLYVKITQKNTQ